MARLNFTTQEALQEIGASIKRMEVMLLQYLQENDIPIPNQMEEAAAISPLKGIYSQECKKESSSSALEFHASMDKQEKEIVAEKSMLLKSEVEDVETEVRKELIPISSENNDDDDEVFLAMAEELEVFIPYVGGVEDANALLPPLEALCVVEETGVRDKAVESLCRIGSPMRESDVITEKDKNGTLQMVEDELLEKCRSGILKLEKKLLRTMIFPFNLGGDRF